MAEQDIDTLYGLLMENHLDLMYLPSGAVAWLFDRPETQVQAAGQLGVEARRHGDEIVDSSLLRADQNVLILRTKRGHQVNVYPDGGYGMDGQPYDLNRISAILSGGGSGSGMLPVSFTSDIPATGDEPVMGRGDPAVAVVQTPQTPGMGMDDLAFDLPVEGGLGIGDLM